MFLGIDHVVIAVADPDAALAELAAFLGVRPTTSGGRHPSWGTRNRLLWLGDTFIELVTVADPREAERSWLGAPLLEALPGPAAIGWAIATDDLDLDRTELNTNGAALGAGTAGERRRPDGETVRWRSALPPELSLRAPFLIEHDLAAAEWRPEDRAARATDPARLEAIALPVDSVDGLPLAPRGAVVGSQLVRAAGWDTSQPEIHISGLDRSASGALLGCRWLVS